MNNIYKKNGLFYLLVLCGTVLMSSCGSRQNIVYFSDLDSSKVKQIAAAEFKEPVIQNDDILNITVQTLDISSTSTLNQTSGSSSGGGGSTGGSASSPSAAKGGTDISGFLVDRNGNVEIPILGVIKLAGLTTTTAKDSIRAKAAKYYKDPTVQVRFANYKVTVLGEVARPASYTLPNEKVSVIDVLALAGDLTVYGKRDNVLLMRENGDKKDIVELNLNSSSLMSSPYFYLRQNDVLYVKPVKSKTAVTNTGRNQLLAIAVSLATLLVTILR